MIRKVCVECAVNEDGVIASRDEVLRLLQTVYFLTPSDVEAEDFIALADKATAELGLRYSYHYV